MYAERSLSVFYVVTTEIDVSLFSSPANFIDAMIESLD
jgi:hypothetical protein